MKKILIYLWLFSLLGAAQFVAVSAVWLWLLNRQWDRLAAAGLVFVSMFLVLIYFIEGELWLGFNRSRKFLCP